MSTRIVAPQEEVRRSTSRLLASLCAEHGIRPVPSLEWSTRMRRVLGRAYIQQNLIRLSAWLSEQQAMATLRHELAHIAAADGKPQAPHGLRWRDWALRLGADPRATSHSGPLNAPAIADRRRYWGLECSRCGLRLMRIRVVPGLYHRDCGPRHGVMRKAVSGTRSQVAAWLLVR